MAKPPFPPASSSESESESSESESGDSPMPKGKKKAGGDPKKVGTASPDNPLMKWAAKRGQ